MKRAEYIKAAAGLLFGRDPYNRGPEKGWRAKLARELGLGNSAISYTMKQPYSHAFDQRLWRALERKLRRLRDETREIKELMAVIWPDEVSNDGYTQEDVDNDRVYVASRGNFLTDEQIGAIITAMEKELSDESVRERMPITLLRAQEPLEWFEYVHRAVEAVMGFDADFEDIIVTPIAAEAGLPRS